MAKKAKLTFDPEAAVQQGRKSLAALFPEFATQDVRLEEIETPLSATVWRLTFSVSLPEAPASPSENPIADLLRPRRLRKTIELEPDHGELVSVKAA